MGLLDDTENEKIDIVKMNRDDAIELLMNEYGETIKRLVFTYIKDYALTEDLTQEIFLIVYLKLDTFAGRSSLKTWVYTIAINKCKDYLKSWHYRKISYTHNLLDFIGTNKGPENNLLDQSDRAEMVQEILKLPIKYREMIILYYYKEFSIHEISVLLKISETTAKVRLHRGREKLRLGLDILGRGELNG
ncbi:sigma-70 family RNA polymerase sigma factor [Neobacillus sp. YX16]|uniref:sigma-70 family RNA polymerase sigma factor n=1 Tax=Neobacillus sp. YX16 TaxID=3047874 RepID=UPI0024C44E31|nr:sigma-70 family RNA polymerase sigma factor [Neobacillus sp. YX16]WHZ02529.1 sigma-70 family RNA polymerase sigma factor [Neobacillus sp. YX16]